ncbi:MAG: type II secretion system F family protein, partial [Pseudomonadota bacterium]
MLVRYKAVGADGKTQTGELEAADQREALKQLARRGLTPISLDEGGADVPWWQRDISLSRNKVSDKDMQSFLFNLAYMLRANLALLPSIEMVTERTTNKRFRRILQSAASDLQNGQPLSEALRRAEPTLQPQVLTALQIGEKSNTLADAATQSAEALAARIKLRAAVISASIYPALLLTMASVVLWVVLFYLLPILEPLFEGLSENGRNPLAPLLLVREVLVIGGQGILVLLAAGLLAYPILARQGLLARGLDRLPFVGGLRRLGRTQQVAGTVANIMLSGGDIDAALGVAVKALAPGTARGQLELARDLVRDGAAFSDGLIKAPAFDPTLRQMAVLTAI